MVLVIIHNFSKKLTKKDIKNHNVNRIETSKYLEKKLYKLVVLKLLKIIEYKTFL